jgi:hypothetical protein
MMPSGYFANKKPLYRTAWRIPEKTVEVQFSYLDTWKVFKECGQGGVGISLASVCDSATTTCPKTLTN